MKDYGNILQKHKTLSAVETYIKLVAATGNYSGMLSEEFNKSEPLYFNGCANMILLSTYLLNVQITV